MSNQEAMLNLIRRTSNQGVAMTGGPMTDEQVREAVRERYAAAATSVLDEARQGGSRQDGSPQDGAATGGCCGGCGCCGGASAQAVDPISSDLYDAGDVPSDTALAASLGCGNPTALAELRPGQDVLDLGCGGGLDVLLSARRVAPGGTAYGLDMTDEMLELARRNQAEAGIDNAVFVKGAIEQVPLPDASVDVVISNCVVNLSTDKDAVLREAFRVLRPGGRFAVSDIVLLRPIPVELQAVVRLWTGCISGALGAQEFVDKLTAAGFEDAGVEVTRDYTRDDLQSMAEVTDVAELPGGMTPAGLVDALDGAFASAFVRGRKP
jgi:arsenite methyltransferase